MVLLLKEKLWFLMRFSFVFLSICISRLLRNTCSFLVELFSTFADIDEDSLTRVFVNVCDRVFINISWYTGLPIYSLHCLIVDQRHKFLQSTILLEFARTHTH